jgi:serine/threonine protein kinase
MATIITSLDIGFKKHFGITDVHWCNSGGQKHVYLITQHRHKRILKLYKDFNERDIREIEIYRKFESTPHIPKLIDVCKYEKDTVSFENYIDGDCLNNICSKYLGQDTEVAKLLTNICNVMNPLWDSKEQIVHRDIKPSNIIIKPNGHPSVIDFGIAKDVLASEVTLSSFQPNSWQFAAPEQYDNLKNQIQYRTDFFSIGALGYFLYYGKLPFGASRQIIESNFKNPSYKITLNQDSKLNSFFQDTLSVSIPERPRLTKDMEKLLSI